MFQIAKEVDESEEFEVVCKTLVSEVTKVVTVVTETTTVDDDVNETVTTKVVIDGHGKEVDGREKEVEAAEMEEEVDATEESDEVVTSGMGAEEGQTDNDSSLSEDESKDEF